MANRPDRCCAVRGDCVCDLAWKHRGPHRCLNHQCRAEWYGPQAPAWTDEDDDLDEVDA